MTIIVVLARLMLELFVGRLNVYAVKWTGRNGRKGFSPACKNRWKPGICLMAIRWEAGRSPAGACRACENTHWPPLDEFRLVEHILGLTTIGVYLLLPEGKCKFGVIDLDDHDGQADLDMAPLILGSRIVEVGAEYGLTLWLEKSGGGKGAHVWLFLEEWTEAKKVREVLHGLIRAAGIKHTKEIEVFPKQDVLGADGLGNLIALPFQGPAMAEGRSMFYDPDTLMPLVVVTYE